MTHRRAFEMVAASALVITFSFVPATAAGGVQFRGPSAYGVVHFGQQIAADLKGPCTNAVTRIRATTEAGTVFGPPARGCYPVVSMPSYAQMTAHGFREGQVVTVAMVSGHAIQPLRYWRIQPIK